MPPISTSYITGHVASGVGHVCGVEVIASIISGTGRRYRYCWKDEETYSVLATVNINGSTVVTLVTRNRLIFFDSEVPYSTKEQE